MNLAGTKKSSNIYQFSDFYKDMFDLFEIILLVIQPKHSSLVVLNVGANLSCRTDGRMYGSIGMKKVQKIS